MSSAQPIPWYLYPISMVFGALEGNGVSTEKGVDLRVPYHTPITPLFPGTVRSVATGPYGQEVDVTGVLNGQQVTASYVHLDQALVSQGQSVGLGTELGISGGQNQGGYHPASPAYSSYPHIEFSLWPRGTSPYGGTPYNPMAYINAVQSSQGAILSEGQNAQALPQSFLGANVLGSLGSLWPNFGGTSVGAAQGATSGGTGDIAAAISSGIQSGLSGVGTNIGSGFVGGFQSAIQNALHVNGLPDLLWRAGLLLVALVLIIVIAQAITMKGTQNTVEMVSQSKPVQTAKNVLPFVK